jgi:hypothetical protein
MLRGLAVVNRRTKAARDVVKWRAELVAELGGEPGMTAARLTRIETLVRTKLLLCSNTSMPSSSNSTPFSVGSAARSGRR